MRRLVVAAVALGTTLTAAATDLATFQSKEWGLTVRYPADVTIGTDFHHSYFDRGAWRVSWAADTGPGTRIRFALPDLKASDAGGDSTGFAELRIGASRDPAVVESCLTYGMNSGNNVETDTRVIGGVRFTEVPDNGDTQMQQTFQSDDLRAVHDGACWAIDLVTYVGGTSNKRLEYSPAALDRLRAILATIRFD